MKLISKILSNSFFKFVFVGVLNTLIGTLAMFFCYRILNLGYWLSSAMNYVVGSIFSYFANKYFTFKSTGKSFKELVKFVLNILICYLAAYGCAKPLIRAVMSYFWQLGNASLDELAMVTGMILFVGVNYMGHFRFS